MPGLFSYTDDAALPAYARLGAACLSEDPASRPSFEEAGEQLEEMLRMLEEAGGSVGEAAQQLPATAAAAGAAATAGIAAAAAGVDAAAVATAGEAQATALVSVHGVAAKPYSRSGQDPKPPASPPGQALKPDRGLDTKPPASAVQPLQLPLSSGQGTKQPSTGAASQLPADLLKAPSGLSSVRSVTTAVAGAPAAVGSAQQGPPAPGRRAGVMGVAPVAAPPPATAATAATAGGASPVTLATAMPSPVSAGAFASAAAEAAAAAGLVWGDTSPLQGVVHTSRQAKALASGHSEAALTATADAHVYAHPLPATSHQGTPPGPAVLSSKGVPDTCSSSGSPPNGSRLTNGDKIKVDGLLRGAEEVGAKVQHELPDRQAEGVTGLLPDRHAEGLIGLPPVRTSHSSLYIMPLRPPERSQSAFQLRSGAAAAAAALALAEAAGPGFKPVPRRRSGKGGGGGPFTFTLPSSTLAVPSLGPSVGHSSHHGGPFPVSPPLYTSLMGPGAAGAAAPGLGASAVPVPSHTSSPARPTHSRHSSIASSIIGVGSFSCATSRPGLGAGVGAGGGQGQSLGQGPQGAQGQGQGDESEGRVNTEELIAEIFEGDEAVPPSPSVWPERGQQ